MGNDIALVAIVIVGGIIAYKYLPTLLKSAGTTVNDATTVATPTAKNDTASQAPVSQTVIQQAINQIVVNQTTINNTKFVNDFDIKVGKSRKKSKENIQLLIAFNPDRYHHSSHYRRYVNIIINHLPMSYERDYWQDLIERQFSDIDDNDDDEDRGGVRFLGPPVRRRKPCVQTVMCMAGERWDSKRCKCVPRPGSGSGSGKGGDCVQTVMCAMNTHWDINKCKCVPNSLPTPNINVDSVTGQKIVVDGASSSYSRSTLVNNLRHISYY